MIKCLECGSKNIHVIAYNTEHVRASMLEPANKEMKEIRNSDLPYILGGHFCVDCQRLISVYDDESFDDKREEIEETEKLATKKQKEFIKKLLAEWEKNPAYRSEYKDLKYDGLTASFANTIIDDLLAKQKKYPTEKKEIPPATEKQVAFIKKKMSEDEEFAKKYERLNFEKLNIYTAKRIIGKMIEG